MKIYLKKDAIFFNIIDEIRFHEQKITSIMNNNFSKFFMALVCLLSVSIAAQAQDSTVYKVIFFTTGSGSDNARTQVQFNEGRTSELAIPFGSTADTLSICIGSDCARATSDYLVGPSGSIIDVSYFQGTGSTEGQRGIAVLTPFGTPLISTIDSVGLFNAKLNPLNTAGKFISLSQDNRARFKLTALNDCGFWGQDEDDFAPNELNPFMDNQVVTGSVTTSRLFPGECVVNVSGQMLILSKPKLCAADVANFPYTLEVVNPARLDLNLDGAPDTLKYTVDINGNVTPVVGNLAASPLLGTLNEDSIRTFKVTLDPGATGVVIPVGAEDIELIYKDVNDNVVGDTLKRQIFFAPEGSTSIVTNDEVEFSLDTASNCMYVAELDDFLEGDLACSGASELYTIEIFDKFGRNLGDTLDADEIAGTMTGFPLEGELLTVHIVYEPTGTLGWARLRLKDSQKPSLEGIDGEIECTHPLVAQLIAGSPMDFIDTTVARRGTFMVPAEDSLKIELTLNKECTSSNDFIRSVSGVRLTANRFVDSLVAKIDTSGFFNADDDFVASINVVNESKSPITVTNLSAVFRQTYNFNAEQRVMLTLDDLKDCSPEAVTLESNSVKYNCPDPLNVWVGAVITRTWKGTDATGNSHTYVQKINIIAPTFDSINMPTEDVALGCEFGEEGADLSPENLFREGFMNAAPTLGCGILEREANKNLCSIVWTYQDQELPGCGPNGKKILRRWTILNWCTKQTFPEFTQAIKVQDNEGPEVTSKDIHFGSEAYDCEGQVRIDLGLTDDCSGVANVVVDYSGRGSISGNVNGSVQAEAGETIIISDLPLNAPVTLNFTISDACGNETQFDTTVTTQDVSAPICKVDDQHNVVVGSDGRGFIRATDVDEGSEDNCGLKALEVRREGGVWGPYVEYRCEDIVNGLLTIEFRAIDYNGNECKTWMEILVEDGIAPTVLSPRLPRLSCDAPELANAEQFLADRNRDGSITAEDFFHDNCVGARIISREYNEEFDNCGAGYATLRVVGRDNSPKTSEVVFVDTLFVTGRNDYKVTFPANRVVEGCGSNVIAEMPVVENNGCSRVVVNMKTDTLKAVNGGCYKIHKVFTVINTCLYDPAAEEAADVVVGAASARMFRDGGDGIIRYTQVIEVTDNVDPTLVIESSNMYCINDEDCDTDVTFTLRANDDCAISQRVSYRVTREGSTFSRSAASVANNSTITLEDLVEGTYTITATTSDNCGNTVSESAEFTVQDCKRPTPVCFSQLNAPLMIIGEEGMVDVWASDFLFYAFDNCTDSAYLIDNAVFEWGQNPIAGTQIIEDLRGRANAGLRVNRSAIGANDCNVEVSINVRVTDRAGNSNFCTAVFLVQDNEKAGCPVTTGAGNIAGSISTYEGDMVEKATVSVEGKTAIPTSVNGTFNFANLEAGSSYTVTASKEDGLTNGVNTQDILIIVRHLLSEKELDNPYNFIAADVNKDGKVSPVDLVNIRKAILRDITEFPNNKSWRFVDKAYTFDSNSDPLAQDFKEAVEIKSLDADSRANFYGVKIGDVNGSAIVNSTQTDSRTAKQLTLGVDDIELKAGEVYTVAVKATDAATLSGYQFTMNFADGVEFQGATSSSIELDENNFGYSSMDLGMITTAWDNVNGIALDANQELFNITLKANVNARLSEVFAVDSRLTPAAGFIGTENVEVANIELAYNNATAETVLFQNTPNPFAEETVISFNLGSAGEARVTVYDMAGKVVTSIEGDYAAGINNVTLNKAQLNASGVLYYQLETANFSATKKMVVLK